MGDRSVINRCRAGWKNKTKQESAQRVTVSDPRGVKVQHEGCIFTTTLRPDLVRKANMEWKMLSFSWGMVQGVGFLCGVQLPLPSVTWNRAGAVQIIYLRKNHQVCESMSTWIYDWRQRTDTTLLLSLKLLQSHWQETVPNEIPAPPPGQVNHMEWFKGVWFIAHPLVSTSPFPTARSKLKLWRGKCPPASPLSAL